MKKKETVHDYTQQNSTSSGALAGRLLMLLSLMGMTLILAKSVSFVFYLAFSSGMDRWMNGARETGSYPPTKVNECGKFCSDS